MNEVGTGKNWIIRNKYLNIGYIFHIMSETAWEDVVDMPDELDDETAEKLEQEASEIQNMKGEVCPYPQVEAKKALSKLNSGDLLMQETDHVPSTENVPKSVDDMADAKIWKSGDGLYRIFLWKE